MSEKPRVILDTNVLVSAVLKKLSPIPHYIYQALRAQRFILVTSAVIMDEVKEVLERKYIIERTGLTTVERAQFVQELRDISMFTPGKALLTEGSRDIKDDKFLTCAVEGKVDYLVSGDKDLLVLKEYEGIKIISPREFVDGVLKLERDVFSLQGSVEPRTRPEDFKAMRKAFIEYLGTRKMKKEIGAED